MDIISLLFDDPTTKIVYRASTWFSIYLLLKVYMLVVPISCSPESSLQSPPSAFEGGLTDHDRSQTPHRFPT